MNTTYNITLPKAHPSFLNIILADDDEEDCLFFKDALEELQLPIKLTWVQNGENLMQLLNTKKDLPNLVFLDINMPGKNGFASLTEIKNDEDLKSIPVIILSTSIDEKKMQWFYENGAQQCFVKPNEFSQLKSLIFKVVTNAAL